MTERGVRTVTLVLTDLVDSTGMTARRGDVATAEVIARHDRMARDLLAAHAGREIDKSDGFLLIFDRVSDAIHWAVAYHDALQGLSLMLGVTLQARAGIHVGQVVLWENPPEDVARGAKPVEVEGIAKPTAARLMSAGIGGQTLLTRAAWEVARGAAHELPDNLQWLEHGEYVFTGVGQPVEVFEVGVPGIAPLKAPSGGGKVRRRETPHNLPAETTAFVGRKAELADITASFAKGTRLLTLLGPGGTGKTRISLRFARDHLDEFVGGVWFCDLTTATDFGGVCQAVARALDVPLTIGEPSRQLGDALASRGRTLLVLDNFEQVVAHAPDTVARWLAMAPDARFLVSSREPLRIATEQRLRLDSLPLPLVGLTDPNELAKNEAVALFALRASAVKANFELGPKNIEDVAAIVRELDGMPLAIELAAARVVMMPPAQIRGRLTRRFDLLRGQNRDVTGRQATLRGAIDWSWELLPPWDQAALAQCSAFAGGFSLEAAEAVIDVSAWPEAPWPMDLVQSLVEKSLVRPPGDDDRIPRFSLYSSIRAYAEDKMADAAAVHRPDGEAATGPAARQELFARHVAFYAHLGDDESLAALDRHGGDDLVCTICDEVANLALAIDRALPEDGESAAHACLAATQAYRQQGPFSDGARLAARVLAAAQGLDDSLAGRLLVAEGSLLKLAGRVDDAAARYDDALTRFRGAADRAGEASALMYLGFLQRDRGRSAEAGQSFAASLALCRALGRRAEEGIVLGNIATLRVETGDLVEAGRLLHEALAIDEEVGNHRSEATVLATLAVIASMDGNLDEASELGERALAIHHELGNRRSEAVVTRNLGILRWEQGRLDESSERLFEALSIARQVGDRRQEGAALADLGRVRRDQGETAEARRLAEQALAACTAQGNLRTAAWVRWDLAELCLQARDLDGAQAQVDAGLAATAGRSPAAEGVLHGIAGEITALKGDVDGALALLDRAERELSTSASGQFLGLVLCRRARVLALAHQTEPARAALSAARASLARLGVGDKSPLGRAILSVESWLRADARVQA